MKTIIITALLIIAAAYGVNTYILEGEENLTSIVTEEIRNFVMPERNPENDIFDVEPVSNDYLDETIESTVIINPETNTSYE